MSEQTNTTDTAVALRGENAVLSKMLDQQVEWMREINSRCVAAGRKPQFDHPEMDALNYKLVKQPDGGFKLTKRAKPLTIVDEDLDGKGRSIAASQRTYADRIGCIEMTADETKLLLMGQLDNGLEVGEVQAVAGPF